jgi:acylphosphatase
MKRLIANVSGELTDKGYSAIVATLAGTLDLKGYIEILADGRAFIIAEGEKDDLEIFARAIRMDNDRIRVKEILADYREPTGEFHNFQEIRPQRDEKELLQRGASAARECHLPPGPDRMEKPERELCSPHNDFLETGLDLKRVEKSIEPIEDEKPATESCKHQREMRDKL